MVAEFLFRSSATFIWLPSTIYNLFPISDLVFGRLQNSSLLGMSQTGHAEQKACKEKRLFFIG